MSRLLVRHFLAASSRTRTPLVSCFLCSHRRVPLPVATRSLHSSNVASEQKENKNLSFGPKDITEDELDSLAAEDAAAVLAEKGTLQESEHDRIVSELYEAGADEWEDLVLNRQHRFTVERILDFYRNGDHLASLPPFARLRTVFEANDDRQRRYHIVAVMRKIAASSKQLEIVNQAERSLAQAYPDHLAYLHAASKAMKDDKAQHEVILYSSNFIISYQYFMALLRLFNHELSPQELTSVVEALKATAVTQAHHNLLFRLVNRLNRVIPDLDWKYEHKFGLGTSGILEHQFGELFQAAFETTDRSLRGLNSILNASDLDPQIAGHPVQMAEPTYTSVYPNLMTPDPILDSRDVVEFPPMHDSPFHNRVIVRNHDSFFHEAALKGFAPDAFDPARAMAHVSKDPRSIGGQPPFGLAAEAEEADDGEQQWQPHRRDSLSAELPDAPAFDSRAFKYMMLYRNTKQQTGKGIIRHKQAFYIVGNCDGLVGLGSAKIDHSEEGVQAIAKLNAYKRMDWVERFEDRTIWTELRHKFRATEIIMRPRPPGFGLRCHPTLYLIFKAAGIKDISAKVWGSRSSLQVAHCAIKMLHAGHTPLGMGDGFGGKGRRMWKGMGSKSKREIELARGRRIVQYRK